MSFTITFVSTSLLEIPTATLLWGDSICNIFLLNITRLYWCQQSTVLLQECNRYQIWEYWITWTFFNKSSSSFLSVVVSESSFGAISSFWNLRNNHTIKIGWLCLQTCDKERCVERVSLINETSWQFARHKTNAKWHWKACYIQLQATWQIDPINK